MKYKLLASAGTLDDIVKLIARFYCNPLIVLSPCTEEKLWSVYKGKDVMTSVRVRQVKNRFRFEMQLDVVPYIK